MSLTSIYVVQITDYACRSEGLFTLEFVADLEHDGESA